MPRRATRTLPVVLIPGPLADTEQDWPRWLAHQLSEAGREVRWCRGGSEPEPQAWLAELDRTLGGLADDGFDVLAHSLGCLLWLHHTQATDAGPRPARVALVAPPGSTPPVPQWQPFYPAPLDIDAVRRAADGTVLVGSDNDPACPDGVASTYGAPLKMATTVVAGAGGLTAADGFGAWRAVLDWCGRDNLAFIA